MAAGLRRSGEQLLSEESEQQEPREQPDEQRQMGGVCACVWWGGVCGRRTLNSCAVPRFMKSVKVMLRYEVYQLPK